MRYEFQNQYGIFDFTPEDEVYGKTHRNHNI